MRIERLEIAGFKSFPELAALEFGRGATAVVGPNGCGKSNIADAVFWVLGELGAATIRARGKELIFSGSSLREPLGVAEVRLHVSGVGSPGANPSGNAAAGNGSGSASNGNGVHAPVEAMAGAARNGASAGLAPELPLSVSDPAREVIVSRRVDASGLSTYEMDGRRCTRREIQRLFAGTGLGPGSYALIEQGRANEVLSQKPDDLRLLVEEAVGLGAYRLNRRESEANLRAAGKALDRVRERLGELDRYIRMARRDSRTASRVREAADRARLLGIAEHAARREALLARIRENVVPEERLDAERERRSRSLSAFERHLEAIRQHAADTDVELRDATRRLGDLGARQARAIALLDEGERAALVRASQVSRFEAEAKTLSARLEDFDAALQASAQRAEQFPALLEELTRAVNERGTARDAAVSREGEAQSAVWHLRREADRARVRLGALRLSCEQHALRRERLATARVGLSGAQRELEARLAHATSVRSETTSNLEAQEKEAAHLGAEVERASQAWRSAAAAAESARDEEVKAERDLAALSARLRSLRAVVQSREQLGTAATSVAEAAERLGLRLGGVVGELVAVDPGYEVAAERLVGVHRFRIESVSDVPSLIQEVGGDTAGSSEVLVSELLRAFGPPGGPPDDGSDRLGDHVSPTDPELGSVVPDAVVTDDLPTALDAFLKRPGLYVTRTGVTVAPPGIVRFGRGAPGEGFLSTRREVAELEVREKEGSRQLAGLSRARAAAGETAEQAGAKLEELRSEHRRAEHQVGNLRLESAKHGEAAENAGKRLEELAAEASANAEEVQRNEEDDARVARQIAADEARLEEASGGLAGREEALRVARRELSDRNQEWREADRELARRKAVAVEVTDHARELGQQAEEGRRRLDRIRSERVAASAEEEGWRARREAARAEQGTSEAGTREWQARESVLAEAAGNLRVRLQNALEAARSRGAELRTVEERLLEIRSGTQEAQSLLRELESEFQRAHGGALEDEIAALPDSLLGRTREEIAAELHSVRERIEKLGPVNEIAQARLRDLEAERREPESHLKDVEQGIADGLRAIRRQDREARRIFAEGFEAVSSGFDEAFRQLFGGGRAELRLVEPKNGGKDRDSADARDILEKEPGAGVSTNGAGDAAPEDPGEATMSVSAANGASATERPDHVHPGIEIAAQPPGKKLQSVRLLSGGEKAMTAIAFLIALFRYRPAPFCLLDEVDAPLDDANVQRFAAMLGELKRDTQLVVITHNRLTMEACEHLYGVTMEEPGVSRLISVQLGDAVDNWIAGTADSGAGGPGVAAHA